MKVQLDLFQHSIIREVCSKYNYSIEELTSNKRSPFYWLPRSELAYRLRSEGKLKWKDIALILDNLNKDNVYRMATRYSILNKLPRLKRGKF